MNLLQKKYISIPVVVIASLIVLLIIFDKVVMPWYVSADEYTVPNLVGLDKDKAIEMLKEMDLEPIEKGPKYDESIPKDHIIFHNPKAGSLVKEGRRVYLYVSGGEPLIKMPSLIGKTKRDAKITVERLGLTLDTLMDVRSEFPANIVVEQNIPEGEFLSKGDQVILKVSIGPEIGMVRVPNIIAKPLSEAENILRLNSLRVGKKTYLNSPNLLPNTVIDQYPSEDKLVAVGDSVDIVLTQSK